MLLDIRSFLLKPIVSLVFLMGCCSLSFASEGSTFPPFDLQYWPPQILWFGFLFGFLYIWMAFWALPRAGKVLVSRRQQIEQDLEEAEKDRLEAENIKYEQEKSIVTIRQQIKAEQTDLRHRLALEYSQRTQDLEKTIQAKLDEADKRVKESQKRAFAHIGTVASNLAEAIVEQLTKRPKIS